MRDRGTPALAPGLAAGARRGAGLALAALCLASASVARQEAGAQRSPQRPAQRPTVSAVTVTGNQRYSAGQLSAAFGQRVGEPLLEEPALRRGIEVLFETFHVRATVELVPVPAEPGAVELRLSVEELPLDLELRIVGNVEIDDDEVREWAGIGEREELYLYQAPRIRARLIDRYHEEGFYFVEVRAVERPGGVDPVTGNQLAPDVIFEIKEGPEVKVRAVELHGNGSLPDRGILFFKRGLSRLAKVELKKPRLFRLFARDFVEAKLDADIIAMRQVYRDLGYLDAVVQLDRLSFTEDREWVTIHIAIDEGQPFRVESLDLRAVERVEDPAAPPGYREEVGELVIPKEELLALLTLRPGDVYQRRVVDNDHRLLRQHYGERGFVEHPSLPPTEGWAWVEPELVFEPDRPAVHVTYRIHQGAEQFIREIRIAGNLHTQDRVVRRLLTVHPGTRADPAEIERSRARLQGTGFFTDEMDPAHPPPTYRYLPTGDPSWKDLEYVIEEGQVLTFNISGGISSTNGAFGTIALAMRNFDLFDLPSSPWSAIDEVASKEAFHGAGQVLRISASPGTEITRFDVVFSEPDIFRLHEKRIGLTLDARRSRRSFDSHDEERGEFGFELSRQFTADSSGFLGFSLGSVDVDDIDTGGEPSLSDPLAVPEDLKAQEGENDLGWMDFGYRYDTVDVRIMPRNGTAVLWRNSVYADALGSDFEFGKTEMVIDVYDEFDEDPDIVSPYVHLGFAGGVGIPYGDTDEVPYTERWYLGGQRMRGFDFRGVGPNEKGFPLGGSTYAYTTLEYRRPLVKQLQPGTYRELEAFQGGVFLDVGVLDPDEFSLDLDELRASTGLLFGISFPFPLTFSFGFPITDGEGDDEQVFEFEIGF